MHVNQTEMSREHRAEIKISSAKPVVRVNNVEVQLIQGAETTISERKIVKFLSSSDRLWCNF